MAGEKYISTRLNNKPRYGIYIMDKLLKAYAANPTQANAERVYRYNQKHPMASAMLDNESQALLKKALHDSGIYPVRMRVL